MKRLGHARGFGEMGRSRLGDISLHIPDTDSHSSSTTPDWRRAFHSGTEFAKWTPGRFVDVVPQASSRPESNNIIQSDN